MICKTTYNTVKIETYPVGGSEDEHAQVILIGKHCKYMLIV